MKKPSVIVVDASQYRARDVLAYVGSWEQGAVILAVWRPPGRAPVYYGCIDPYHRCSSAWFKMRGVDLAAVAPEGRAHLVAVWDIDDAVVCTDDGSACFWGRRSGEAVGGPLASILPAVSLAAPHIGAALAGAREEALQSLAVGVAAMGVEVALDGGEKRYYAAVPEERDGVTLGWWLVYVRAVRNSGEACVVYDGSGAGRITFGACRASEFVPHYVLSGGPPPPGSRSVKSARVGAVVEGGAVAVAVFDNNALVGGRVVKVKEALGLLSPRAARLLSKIIHEGLAIVYG